LLSAESQRGYLKQKNAIFFKRRKASLLSIPTYCMSLFNSPTIVIKEVGKVAKKLSLACDGQGKEIPPCSLVNWDSS